MTLLSRQQLKNLFRNGTVPSEGSFADLIDSAMNKVDDGFDKSPVFGNSLAPGKGHDNWISLFKDDQTIQDQKPSWLIERIEQEAPASQEAGMGFSVPGANTGDPSKKVLFLSEEQADTAPKVGIGTTKPKHTLEVEGQVAMRTRLGTFTDAKIDPQTVVADGNYHPILSNLSGMHAYEVVAMVAGSEGSGKYAMVFATAMAAHNPKRSLIHRVSCTANSSGDQLMLRFYPHSGDSQKFDLEIATRKPYVKGGPYPVIRFRITNLWEDNDPTATTA